MVPHDFASYRDLQELDDVDDDVDCRCVHNLQAFLWQATGR